MAAFGYILRWEVLYLAPVYETRFFQLIEATVRHHQYDAEPRRAGLHCVEKIYEVSVSAVAVCAEPEAGAICFNTHDFG